MNFKTKIQLEEIKYSAERIIDEVNDCLAKNSLLSESIAAIERNARHLSRVFKVMKEAAETKKA